MGSWRQAALFGVCGWGLPVGVLFALTFWADSDPRPPFWGLLGLSVALFAAGGVAFGVLVYWAERLTAVGPVATPAAAERSDRPAERGPPLRVLFEWIGWESDEPAREVIDLADGDRFHLLFMMFGTGNYIEARVVGESPEAIEAFRGLVRLGGYTQAGGPPAKARLYRAGDEGYPAPEPFVFVCPVPDPELAGWGSATAEPSAAADPARQFVSGSG